MALTVSQERGMVYSSITDRNNHFERAWKTVSIKLPNGEETTVNIDKESFWNGTCRELMSQQIGRWLLDSKIAPWHYGKPPKRRLTPNGIRYFILDKE